MQIKLQNPKKILVDTIAEIEETHEELTDAGLTKEEEEVKWRHRPFTAIIDTSY